MLAEGRAFGKVNDRLDHRPHYPVSLACRISADAAAALALDSFSISMKRLAVGVRGL